MAFNDVRIPAKAPIDPQKHTPAFKIFNYRFLCSVQQIHLMTEEYLKDGGYVTSGFKEIDRQQMYAWVPIRPTIVQMANFIDEGVSFRLKDPQDAPRIYHIIREHLRGHAKAAEFSIHRTKVPVEDLRKLDALAEFIYPVSRGMEEAMGPEESDFHRKLREFGGGGFIAQLRQAERDRIPKIDVAKPADPGHQSQIPEIAASLGKRDKPWLKR